MISGTTRTWRMNRRGMIDPSPGKFPPKRNVARYEPTIGIDSTIENMMRSAGPRHEVVGQRVPDEAVGEGQDQQRDRRSSS